MAEHRCTIENIDIVLENEILLPYADSCGEAMARGIDRTMVEMVKQTKENAPTEQDWSRLGFPEHNRGAKFKKAIASKTRGAGSNHEATWYVRPPEHRLTHLLVHGHQQFVFGKPTGGRAQSFPFLHYAYAEAQLNLVPYIKEEIERL